MSTIFKALERSEASLRSTTAGGPQLSSVVPPPAPRIPVQTEEYERLKVMLTLQAARSALKRVLLVSAVPGEGVSTATIGLATALAASAAQGVLVAETHAGPPALAARLGASVRHGLGELLTKTATREDAIVATPTARLWLLGRGATATDFSQPRSLALLDDLLSGLVLDYDFCLLDGGSIEECPQTALVAARSDGVLLVVEAERTSAARVKEARRILQQAGAPLLGVVLNRRRDYLPEIIKRRLG